MVTGSGWSIPYGGYSVQDLTERVRGELYGRGEIKLVGRFHSVTREEGRVTSPTYEEVLGLVEAEGDSQSVDKLKAAIQHVLRLMDNDMALYRGVREELTNIVGYHGFLGQLGKGGVIVTLNHDLWFERFVCKGFQLGLHIVGLRDDEQLPRKLIDTSWECAECWWQPQDVVPSVDLCELSAEHLNVLKLHGGMNWRDDKGSLIVQGARKWEQMHDTPVLKKLYDTQWRLLSKAKKVLIYGYGFQDPHINKSLANAANKGATFYIFDRASLVTFLEGHARTPPEGGWGSFIHRVKHYSSVGEQVFGHHGLGNLDHRLKEFLE